MQIIIGEGIDHLKFGMKQDDVENILGEADYVFDDPDQDAVNWVYNAKKITLVFYADESNKFAFIKSKNPDLKYNNNLVIGRSASDLEAIFGKQNWDIDRYDSFTTYHCEKLEMTIYVEYDNIDYVEFGALFDTHGEFVWKFGK